MYSGGERPSEKYLLIFCRGTIMTAMRIVEASLQDADFSCKTPLF